MRHKNIRTAGSHKLYITLGHIFCKYRNKIFIILFYKISLSFFINFDCVVDDFAHVAVGAHLCGTVNVGESTWIGAGATVSNNVNVCENCMIGAGAVVIKDIEEEGTYIGVPVRKYR